MPVGLLEVDRARLYRQKIMASKARNPSSLEISFSKEFVMMIENHRVQDLRIQGFECNNHGDP